MREPVRWLADKNTLPELRELLGSARDVPALSAALDRRLGALARQLSAAPVTAGAAAMAAKSSLGGKTLGWLGTSKLATKLVVGSALLSGASVATYVATRSSPASLPAATSVAAQGSGPLLRGRPSARHRTATPATSEPEATEPSAAARPSRTVSGAPVARTEPVARPDRSEWGPQDAVNSASFPDPSIADEARLLESARAALGTDPARALRITEEHARKHPMAQLSAERELIVIDALVRLGRRDEALRRAAPGLARAPNSLYAKRLRQLLGQAEPE
ncbi:MAG: hypothetical protein JW940_22625 [Polyangiaceae bacterium]|nr:hypothetical protein [Polyangiaceae bacterium]